MKKTTFSGLSRIRRKHQMKIFQLLQEGESTCNQIAKTLKLSQVSTYIILEDLLQKKIIKANNASSVTVGRKPSIFSLNEDFGYFVAVDFSSHCVKIIVFNILGKILLERISEPHDVLSIDDINQTINTLQEMLKKLSISNNQLKEICLCSPGRIDNKTGYFWVAARFSDCKNINLQSIFSQSFDCPIIIKNDMLFATMGNLHYIKANGFDNVLYLYISSNVGSSLYINGSIHDGATSNAGEFGSTVDFDGKFLAPQITLSGMMSSYDKAINNLEQRTNEEEFIKLYHNNDHIAVNIAKESAKKLSYAINNLISVLDIPTIIIAGNITRLGDGFLNTLNQLLQKPYFYQPPQCVFLNNGRKAMIDGCIEIAIKEGIDNELLSES